MNQQITISASKVNNVEEIFLTSLDQQNGLNAMVLGTLGFMNIQDVMYSWSAETTLMQQTFITFLVVGMLKHVNIMVLG